ncbi:hypothetical protein [Herbiconiux daphne]|uniref:Prophage protein n=1 Tax=Herbiconiux daphne TaxID=2970914 RepID=A0ABT2HBN8_9MICO|nr:hypothetical protein [Herbiconiux daphne]MCS5737359.1 hypothetical protein [Herbiconiux daphne]
MKIREDELLTVTFFERALLIAEEASAMPQTARNEPKRAALLTMAICLANVAELSKPDSVKTPEAIKSLLLLGDITEAVMINH